MPDVVCPYCGGAMYVGLYLNRCCDTCGLVIHWDGTFDFSEMEPEAANEALLVISREKENTTK